MSVDANKMSNDLKEMNTIKIVNSPCKSHERERYISETVEGRKSKVYRIWNSDLFIRARNILGMVFFSSVFIICCAAVALISTTDIFEPALLKNLMLVNNSAAFRMWKNPPVHPILQIYIFNYTNVNEFTLNGDKLKVVEVGPYTYREFSERVNVTFHKNGTLTYQERGFFKFVPELSNGKEDDIFMVPSLTFIGAIGMLQKESFLSRYLSVTALRGFSFPTFIKLKAGKYLWGYEDTLFILARNNPFLSTPSYNKVGIFVAKTETSGNTFTIHTGENNITKLGEVTNYNGKSKLSVWDDDSCNRIDGSTGSIFPPKFIPLNYTISIFNPDVCRHFPLTATEYFETENGIPAVRFNPPSNVFDGKKSNPKNKCYCPPSFRYCPPDGVIDLSPCHRDVPIVMSFPHFYLGDPQLLETVDGLKPDPERHLSYIELHKYLGIPVGGQSRFQLNIRVRKLPGFDILEGFKDNSILPLAWFSEGINELPPELQEMLYHVTFSTRRLELIILFIMVLIAIICCTVVTQRIIRASQRKTLCDDPVTSLYIL